jgi:acyl carrier protein
VENMMNQKMVEVICRILEMDAKSSIINENTNLIEDYEMDSLKLVELIIEIESEFQIIIEDNDLDLDKISSVSFLNSLVKDKK